METATSCQRHVDMLSFMFDMPASDGDIVRQRPDLAFIALYATEDDIIGGVARSEPDRTFLQCPSRM
jgi:hypothetical protein